MIVGGILAVVGFLGIALIALEPLIRAYRVIFQREDDYMHYENRIGRQMVETNKKTWLGAFSFLLVVGLVMFGTGYYYQFSGRGSIFGLSQTAGTVSDIGTQANGEEGMTALGEYVDSKGVKHTFCIRIAGDRIFYRNEFEGDIDQFENFMGKLDRANRIYIYDDYAVAETVHGVKALLNEKGIAYDME